MIARLWLSFYGWFVLLRERARIREDYQIKIEQLKARHAREVENLQGEITVLEKQLELLAEFHEVNRAKLAEYLAMFEISSRLTSKRE